MTLGSTSSQGLLVRSRDSQSLHEILSELSGYRAGDVLALVAGMHPGSRDARSIRYLLLQQHLQLDVLLDCLLAAVDARATDEVTCLRLAFDARLRAHLEFEERHLISGFAQSHPEDARRLLADHALIRDTLLQLAVAFDRHQPRAADECRRFAQLLRLHAARDVQLLYPWAEQNIGADASAKLLERFS